MDLLSLYQRVSEKTATPEDTETAENFWGAIPSSSTQVLELAEEVRKNIRIINQEQNLEVLAKIVEKTHRQLGSYTSKIKDASNMLENGLVEIGHQPLFYGGGSFLLNKVCLTANLCELSDQVESNLQPFFFIGDHDQVQNELTVTRFPQVTSSSGLEIQYKVEAPYLYSPMHALPSPPEKAIREWNGKIRNNYLELIKFAKIKPQYRPLLLERLDEFLGLVLEARVRQESYSKWIMQLWSDILVLKNDLPVIFAPFSDPDLRELTLPVFEHLIQEDTREKFASTLNGKREQLLDLGYVPGLPYRQEDEYAPFFLECHRCLGKTRISATVEKNTIRGKCPTCGEEINHEFNPRNPDLSELVFRLSPRADTRTLVIASLFPVLVHVGGTGELVYHAQVFPAMRKLGITPSVFVKYNSLVYNTPWAEIAAPQVTELGATPVQERGMFTLLSEFSKANDQGTYTKVTVNIQEELETRRLTMELLKDKLSEDWQEKRNKKARQGTILLANYLSHVYGTFSKGKINPEVSWNWIDFVLQVGLRDLAGFHRRQTKPAAPLARNLFVSAGKYN
ncbi:MAG: bacillithiol biosynthesis BshC [Candidatus Odinarchaeota archaeon]